MVDSREETNESSFCSENDTERIRRTNVLIGWVCFHLFLSFYSSKVAKSITLGILEKGICLGAEVASFQHRIEHLRCNTVCGKTIHLGFHIWIHH